MSISLILRKRKVIWSLLALPGLISYPIFFFRDGLALSFWKNALTYSGYFALALFVLVLSLNPLVYLAPRIQWLKALNTHRRAIGVATFIYVCMHFLSYIIKRIIKYGSFPFSSFLNPVVLLGASSFLILLLLAVTSNNYSVQKLGYTSWKRLHKGIYLTEGLVFLHLLLQKDLQITVACLVFIPLIILQWVARRSIRNKNEVHF